MRSNLNAVVFLESFWAISSVVRRAIIYDNISHFSATFSAIGIAFFTIPQRFFPHPKGEKNESSFIFFMISFFLRDTIPRTINTRAVIPLTTFPIVLAECFQIKHLPCVRPLSNKL